MKLHPQHGAGADHGGDIAAILYMRQTLRGVCDLEMVGMHEIGVIAGVDAVEHGVRGVQHQIVPAHVRHFQRRIVGRDRHDLTADPVQPVGVAVLAAQRCHQLHADTDAQEGPRLDLDRLAQGRQQAGMAAQFFPAGRKGAVAGQHDAVGACHHVGV